MKKMLLFITLIASFFVGVPQAYAQSNPQWVVAPDEYCKNTCAENQYCTLETTGNKQFTGKYACQDRKTVLTASAAQPEGQVPEQNVIDLNPFNWVSSFWNVLPTSIWQQEALEVDPETNMVAMNVNSFNTALLEGVKRYTITNLKGEEGTANTNNAANAGSGGLIGMTGGLIGSMIEQTPASSVDYIADVGSRAGIVSKAYAQGTGYYALQPVLPIWKAFRNVAYLGFILIFVVIGFMIMFRTKVNQQVVIGVQQAIPNILFTLILVTFSYAIAGLVIDLIYMAIYLFVGILAFGDALLLDGGEKALNRILDGNLWTVIFDGRNTLISQPAKAIGEITKAIFDNLINVAGFDVGSSAIAGMVQGAMELVLLFAVMIAMWKLFFVLLFAYIRIILNVIFSPILILFNALPGSGSFTKWLRNIISDAAIFPVTAGMFIIAGILAGPGTWHPTDGLTPGNALPGGEPLWDTNPWGVADGVGYAGGNWGYGGEGDPGWMPPLLNFTGNAEDASANIVLGLLSIGMILLTPQVAKFTKEFIQAQENKYTPTIFEQIQGGYGVASSPVRAPINFAKGPLLGAGLQHWMKPETDKTAWVRGLPNPFKGRKSSSSSAPPANSGGPSSTTPIS